MNTQRVLASTTLAGALALAGVSAANLDPKDAYAQTINQNISQNADIDQDLDVDCTSGSYGQTTCFVNNEANIDQEVTIEDTSITVPGGETIVYRYDTEGKVLGITHDITAVDTAVDPMVVVSALATTLTSGAGLLVAKRKLV